jgi:hypothetical protein
MRLRSAPVALTALVLAFGGLAGCGGADEGTLPPANKQLSQEDADKIAKQVQEGMKGGYKGAPGAPPPKMPK